MQHAAQRRHGRKHTRFPGIVADAKSLGVHRNSLLLCLNGKRPSKILSARYRQLKGKKLSTTELLLISDYNRRQAKKGATSP
jgi:hypothetical protein